MSARPPRAVFVILTLLSAALALTGGPLAPAYAKSLSLPFETPPPTRMIFPSQVYEVGGNSLSLTTGDFNGDGVRDVAVANRGVYNQGLYTDGDVSVLLGYGDG